MRSLREHWEDYRRIVLQGCGEVQIYETRKGFYAGAWAVFSAMNSFITEDGEPTEEEFQAIEALYAELQAHLDEVNAAAAGAGGPSKPSRTSPARQQPHRRRPPSNRR